MIKLKSIIKENIDCPRCKGWKYIHIRPGIPNIVARCPLCNFPEGNKIITIYRGEWTGNKGGSYYTTDKEWARQFTQSGLDKEIKTAKIKLSSIFKPEGLPLPKAYDEKEFDQAIEDAKKGGFDAVWFDENEGNPNSIYIINKKALLKETIIKELTNKLNPTTTLQSLKKIQKVIAYHASENPNFSPTNDNPLHVGSIQQSLSLISNMKGKYKNKRFYLYKLFVDLKNISNTIYDEDPRVELSNNVEYDSYVYSNKIEYQKGISMGDNISIVLTHPKDQVINYKLVKEY